VHLHSVQFFLRAVFQNYVASVVVHDFFHIPSVQPTSSSFCIFLLFLLLYSFFFFFYFLFLFISFSLLIYTIVHYIHGFLTTLQLIKELVGLLSLYSFSRLPFTIPFNFVPPKSFTFTYPPYMTLFTSYGTSQCIWSLPGCCKNLFS
jgi:hypothetical protein